MNNEIKERQKLLNENGDIANPGYAKTMLYDYDKTAVKASKWRLKEWDYYYIGNDSHALCLTVSDMGYIGAISATVINFKAPSQVTKSAVKPFVFGKFNMPETSVVGDVRAVVGKTDFTITNDGGTRHLFGVYADFGGKGIDLKFDVTLSDVPSESMVIATPFSKPKHFYFNQKINCMSAVGTFSVGADSYVFDKASHSLATLDWGRGTWTYNNTWYWGSMQTILDDGTPVGFNIGYGFGDTNNATENMIFYNGKSHKIDDVEFIIPTDDRDRNDYMKEWQFTSSDERFELSFTPIIDRYAPVNLGILAMIPHQVFGLFSGNLVLDDGKVIEIKNALGFAEKVHNRW
ncbi:MAG: DUF2804 domain-containing protein [Clostridia bacterium]